MCLLAAVTAPRKIIKISLDVFERGENVIQNGILDFAFRLNQSSGIALES